MEKSNWRSSKMLYRQICSIYQDELRHVGYTAELLETIVENSAKMMNLTI